MMTIHTILHELKSREPIFYHLEKFGSSAEDTENQMCDEFWEVGAAGKQFKRSRYWGSNRL